MAKKINLSIPQPCHESWYQMSLTEKGKFCNACQKEVIDFSHRSDAALVAFFKRPPSSVCGRFHPDQLYRDITLPKKRIPWIRYFFQFALPAFLISLKATAQERKVGKVAVCYSPIKEQSVAGTVRIGLPEIKEVTGRVTDESGNGIPYASVLIKGTNTGVACNSDGYFRLSSKQRIEYLVVSGIGFQTREFRIADSQLLAIQLIQLNTTLMGEVGAIVVKHRKRKPVPLLQRVVGEAPFSKFKVFPNPAVSGGTIYLEWKKVEKGAYQMAVLNPSGQVVLSRLLEILQKSDAISLQLPHLVAGNYAIVLIQKASGKTFTEKIIVR